MPAEVLIATPDPDDHDKIMQGIAELEAYLDRQTSEYNPGILDTQPALFDQTHMLGQISVGGFLEN